MNAMFKQELLSHAVKALIAAMVFLPNPALSIQFDVGAIEGSFDSQLSIGSSWRVEGQDSALIKNSDGSDNFSNSDDGNRNYENGDAFSQTVKGVHDLEVRYRNYGGFVRGKYWHDAVLENNDVEYGHNPTVDRGGQTGSSLDYSDGNRDLDDSDFNSLSKASGAAILDAFVYGEFDVMDRPLDLRLGKQVVSWGESTFIRGGINSINPVDVNAFVRPGAEIKEGLLPVNMAYGNLGLTDNLSVESFYQLEFQETVIPGCGTYFATNDYAPEGCDNVSILNGQFSVQRNDDGIRRPDGDGQYGVAFRYFSEALGNTEFGLYAMNIHSRAPLASGTKTTLDAATLGSIAQTAAGAWIAANAANPGAPTAEEQAAAASVGQSAALAQKIDTTSYFIGYPEDVQITGLSFATNVGAVALSGEISHKFDAPIQINGPMLLGVLVQGASPAPELIEVLNSTNEGDPIEGYRLFDISQAQISAVQTFGKFAGANRTTLIGELAYTHIHSFKEGTTEIKFGRSDIFGLYDPTDPANDSQDGFVTESSWGYRTRVVMEYSDAFLGVNLEPMIAWSHDVEGYSPQPGGNFVEGQQSLGLTLKGTYLESYTGSIGYTQYSGGKYSAIKDRDFASFSLGMLF